MQLCGFAAHRFFVCLAVFVAHNIRIRISAPLLCARLWMQINLEEAVTWLRFVEWRLPFIIGHVMHGNLRWLSDFATYVSGGAGILLPRTAALEVSSALFTPLCPLLGPGGGLNDVTVSRCAWALHIPLVHCNLLQTELSLSTADEWRARASMGEIGTVLSAHRVWPDYMARWIARDLAITKWADVRKSRYTWAPKPPPR